MGEKIQSPGRWADEITLECLINDCPVETKHSKVVWTAAGHAYPLYVRGCRARAPRHSYQDQFRGTLPFSEVEAGFQPISGRSSRPVAERRDVRREICGSVREGTVGKRAV